MADEFYAGWTERGSAPLGGKALLRANCVQTAGGTPVKLERAKGFEPSTPTLARLCSSQHPAKPDLTIERKLNIVLPFCYPTR